MITLTPLSASASSSSASEPVSYLLELDEARILLDIGQSDYRAGTYGEYEDKIRECVPSRDVDTPSGDVSHLQPY